MTERELLLRETVIDLMVAGDKTISELNKLIRRLFDPVERKGVSFADHKETVQEWASSIRRADEILDMTLPERGDGYGSVETSLAIKAIHQFLVNGDIDLVWLVIESFGGRLPESVDAIEIDPRARERVITTLCKLVMDRWDKRTRLAVSLAERRERAV